MKSKVEPSLRCHAAMDIGCQTYSCLRCLKHMNPYQVRVCDWQVAQRIAADEEDMTTPWKPCTDGVVMPTEKAEQQDCRPVAADPRSFGMPQRHFEVFYGHCPYSGGIVRREWCKNRKKDCPGASWEEVCRHRDAQK